MSMLNMLALNEFCLISRVCPSMYGRHAGMRPLSAVVPALGIAFVSESQAGHVVFRHWHSKVVACVDNII